MKSHVYFFMPRFAPMVESGAKLQTIRQLRNRMPKVGEMASLREWTGKPYRSKQRLLREARITSVTPIVIHWDYLERLDPAKAGARFSPVEDRAELDLFAVADGFDHWDQLTDWFSIQYGLSFLGFVTQWEPLARVDTEHRDQPICPRCARAMCCPTDLPVDLDQGCLDCDCGASVVWERAVTVTYTTKIE